MWHELFHVQLLFLDSFTCSRCILADCSIRKKDNFLWVSAPRFEPGDIKVLCKPALDTMSKAQDLNWLCKPHFSPHPPADTSVKHPSANAKATLGCNSPQGTCASRRGYSPTSPPNHWRACSSALPLVRRRHWPPQPRGSET